ncbi:glucosidase 2 subunit beta-like isoform X2 [Branchiostoma lanceolatum]|uniref:glucosidase 2 subunit beta-like isoform X2 n=1 Tax=Branchiostoma lanceolatum TaxID=7740 RepID=UPI0034568CB3
MAETMPCVRGILCNFRSFLYREMFLGLLVLHIVSPFYNTAAVEILRPRGVSLLHKPFYDESKPFTCLDGSATIPFDQVNDDYCDCKDGTDEPGTAACPNMMYYCSNKGFTPKTIPSSRVNDGICDCCDGTDEYSGLILCQDKCREMGAVELEQRKKQAEVINKGFQMRQTLVADGKQTRQDREAKLNALKEEKQVVETKKQKAQAAKEAAEAPEKEAVDKHKQAWDEVKAARELERQKEAGTAAFSELDLDGDGLVKLEEFQTHLEFDDDVDGEVTEDEAKTHLGDVTEVDLDRFLTETWPEIKDLYQGEKDKAKEPPAAEPTKGDPDLAPSEETPPPPPAEEEEEREEEEEEEHDDDEPDIDVDKDEPKTDEDEMPDYDEETKQLISAADQARAEYTEANKKVSDIDAQIRQLEKQLGTDFGAEAEYSSLDGQCFELETKEYKYKLCPFDKCSQSPKHGGSETTLGRWESWAGPEDNKYSAMKYTKGQNCWNGPDRSTEVRMTCGIENKLLSASEPNRCEYVFEFETPAMCSKEVPNNPEFSHEEL